MCFVPSLESYQTQFGGFLRFLGLSVARSRCMVFVDRHYRPASCSTDLYIASTNPVRSSTSGILVPHARFTSTISSMPSA
jgi:hypothetical protein